MSINPTKKLLLNLPRPVKRGLVIYCDIIINVLTVWLTFGLRLDQWEIFQGNQWLVPIASIVFSVPIFWYFGLYRTVFRYAGSVALAATVRALMLYGSIFLLIFTLVGVEEVPRSIGAIQPILLFIGISSSRYFVRYWLGNVELNPSHSSMAQGPLVVS